MGPLIECHSYLNSSSDAAQLTCAGLGRLETSIKQGRAGLNDPRSHLSETPAIVIWPARGADERAPSWPPVKSGPREQSVCSIQSAAPSGFGPAGRK